VPWEIVLEMCEAVREYADRRFPEYDAVKLGSWVEVSEHSVV